MEGIILLAISFIIGSLLKNNKEKNKEQRVPKKVITPQSVMQEFEKKSTHNKKKASRNQQPIKPIEETSARRPAAVQLAVVKQKPKQEGTSFKFPSAQEELVQSIIMAEILGPPKSKR